MRAAFERLMFDQHLSPGQILGLWESNEAARQAIERLFGPEVLEGAAERVRLVPAVRAEQAKETAAPERHSRDVSPKLNGSVPPSDVKPTPVRAGQRTSKQDSVADPGLALMIDPGWGDQRVFRLYRAALVAVHNQYSGQVPEIARFRDANAAVEARLREKLPERMIEIDAISLPGRSQERDRRSFDVVIL